MRVFVQERRERNQRSLTRIFDRRRIARKRAQDIHYSSTKRLRICFRQMTEHSNAREPTNNLLVTQKRHGIVEASVQYVTVADLHLVLCRFASPNGDTERNDTTYDEP